MRGGLKLFQTLRAFGFLGALEHVEARELRGAVQQCSDACADATAKVLGSQAASLVAGAALRLAVCNTLEITWQTLCAAVQPCKRDPGGVVVLLVSPHRRLPDHCEHRRRGGQ